MSFADRRELLVVARPRCTGHGETPDCAYRIEWRINPHMRPGAADPVRAEAQHRTLVRELRRAGAEVLELPFVHGAFDSVFIKDSALLHRANGSALALLSRFATRVRQREQVERSRALERAGFDVMEVTGARLEGGDVVRLPDGGTLLGHGFRSERAAAELLAAHVGCRVTALELVDPWLYHLDTALNVLSDGTVLLCREAFTSSSLARLSRLSSVRELCFIPRDEALGFALNFVEVSGTVVTGAVAPVTTRLLEQRGLRVRQVRLSEFQLAGGSAACLVSRVYDTRRLAVSETSEMRSTSA